MQCGSPVQAPPGFATSGHGELGGPVSGHSWCVHSHLPAPLHRQSLQSTVLVSPGVHSCVSGVLVSCVPVSGCGDASLGEQLGSSVQAVVSSTLPHAMAAPAPVASIAIAVKCPSRSMR